jgi:hypothetical protein
MLSKIENTVHDILIKKPFARKIAKRVYHLSMYAISPKIKVEGNLKRLTPKDEYEYFFGYYDKSPWDITDRYVLCLRAKETHKNVAPKDDAEIILIDSENGTIKILGVTKAWNVQQGCMLQWLGPNFADEILYNDFRNGEFCSVILNINTSEERVIFKPIYSVSDDGSFALTLDFTRLHEMRPGYGYSNTKDVNSSKSCPDSTCIWYVNLKTGEIKSILKYTDFVKFEVRKEMMGAKHKVNHIMINPSGNRFMVLHRWYKDNIKYSRLVTANIDGSDMYNLSDDNFVSHCNWKTDSEIIAFLNKNEFGHAYYLLKDQSKNWKKVWEELKEDGHPSYSLNRELAITDTYPNRQRLSSLFLIKNNEAKRVARVYSPFKYDNDTRCDLHPRFDRKGSSICIDAVFEGKRGLYILNIEGK